MLDGGPSRTSQQLDRRPSARRPETVRRETQPIEAPAPRPVSSNPNPAARSAKPKFFHRILKPLIIVAIVLAALLAGWFLWSNSHGFGSTIDTSKYQAVFFSNGQVYFGKLQANGPDSLVLSKVYYLKSSAGDSNTNNPQGSSSSSESSNVELIKLGNEIHGPEDSMEISRDQVLFFENLKDDGQVSKLMKQYKANN